MPASDCITRDKKGTFRSPRGAVIRDKNELARLRKMALPVQYRDVCYATDPQATVQAVGRDHKSGRLQYRYHARHTAAQGRKKFARLLKFAKLLPPLRKAIRRTLQATRARGRSKEHVTHQALRVLDQCRFRVGNPMYLQNNQSHGLSNLDSRHVRLKPSEATIEFKGKAGQLNTCVIRDKDTLQYLRHRIRGGGRAASRLFEYVGDSGKTVGLHPQDVNRALRAHGDITAKDFRTWQANLYFVEARIRGDDVPESVRHAAAQLYHTPAVCKSSYLHPALLAMDAAELRRVAGRAPPGRKNTPAPVQAAGGGGGGKKSAPQAAKAKARAPAPPLPPKHVEMLERCLYRLLRHVQVQGQGGRGRTKNGAVE